MSNLTPLADAQAPPAAKEVFQTLQAKMGTVLNFFRTLGHAPAILKATLDFDRAIQHDLDPKLRELAYLKASQLNGCKYCLHYHKGLGKKAGLSPSQVEELDRFEQSSAYSEQEKLVLRFAEQWTKQSKVSRELVDQLGKSLSPAAVVTLAGTVGLANWTNKFNETFAVELP